MKPSKGKRLLLALVLWASLLPAAGAAGTGTTEYGMEAESLTAAGPAPSGKIAVSQPLGETGVFRQKDLKAELLARYGERKNGSRWSSGIPKTMCILSCLKALPSRVSTAGGRTRKTS